MVIGLDKFRTHFKDYIGNYILIGGTACDEHFAKAGLGFRVTKDLDIVLIVETLNKSFTSHFFSFIENGKYGTKEISNKKRNYYRFMKPEKEGYPEQIELFSRNPDFFDLNQESQLTPIPTDEELSSLSAILMDDVYYQFTMKNSTVKDDLHFALPGTLICLKAYAYLDLKRRKLEGEKIHSRHIKKHRNDVFKLTTILAESDIYPLPATIEKDLVKFIDDIKSEPGDFNAIKDSIGDKNLNIEDLFIQLIVSFEL